MDILLALRLLLSFVSTKEENCYSSFNYYNLTSRGKLEFEFW